MSFMQSFHNAQYLPKPIFGKAITANAGNASVALNAVVNVVSNINIVLVVLVQIIRYSRGRLLA